jgi:hypothetical protein
MVLKHADSFREPVDNEIVIRPWNFLAPFAKKWDSRFDNGKIPDDDSSFLDELRRVDTESKGVELFVRPYDEDTTSPDQEAILHLCQNSNILDPDQPEKESVWLDDRAYAAYPPDSNIPAPFEDHQNDNPISTPYGRGSNDHDSELVANSDPMTVGPSQPDSASAKSSPTSRRYLRPLTAQKLYEELKKKVTIPYPIKLSGPRSWTYVQQQHLFWLSW